MSPRTEEQFQKIREEKKALIMETALELFANEGYHNASINDIAKKAGISKGLIYNYFDSKEELIKTIIFKSFDEFIQFIDPNRDGILTKEEIRLFIEKSFTILQENLHFWKLYFATLMQPEVYRLVEEKIWEIASPFMKMMENFFQSQGYKDPVAETRFLAALLDGVQLHLILDPEHYPLEETIQRIYDIYHL